LLNVGAAYNDHDVGRRGELINKAGELGIPDHHGLELVVGLDAAELELLDDVADLLEPVHVLVADRVKVGDHKESASLEKHHFVSVDRLAEHRKTLSKLSFVGQQNANDL
jgi:hypothetical protein